MVIKQILDARDKPVISPGVDEPEKPEEEEKLLEGEDIKSYRAVSARLNHLSQDRPDLLYAVKECCREMATPAMGSWQRHKRIATYLLRTPRVVWTYPWQSPTGCIDVFGDANWAGCRRTRTSTSCGAMLQGIHCTKAWSKTQAIVAKSYGESELYGVVRASCEGLGSQPLMQDMGNEVLLKIHVDASAAKSICERTGLDHVRLIDVNVLWVQEQQVRHRAPLVKTGGKTNSADLNAKHLHGDHIEMHLHIIGLYYKRES